MLCLKGIIVQYLSFEAILPHKCMLSIQEYSFLHENKYNDDMENRFSLDVRTGAKFVKSQTFSLFINKHVSAP